MGTRRRPLRADAQRNREQLLIVARQVFAAEGLEVPIDEIARRAGVGVGTVYRHFPNKEALFEAIILDQLERFLVEAEVLLGEADPEQALVEFLERYLAAGAAKKDFLDALMRVRRGPLPPPTIQKVFKRLREVLGQLLVRAQQAGVLRADIGLEETLALLHGVSAAGLSYAGPPEGRPRIWAVVLDGLLTPGAARRRAQSP